MEQFRTKVDVEGSGNCGDHAVMATLKYIGRERKETLGRSGEISGSLLVIV